MVLTESWWTETEAAIQCNWARICENGSQWADKEIQGGDKVDGESIEPCIPRKRWSKGPITKATQQTHALSSPPTWNSSHGCCKN